MESTRKTVKRGVIEGMAGLVGGSLMWSVVSLNATNAAETDLTAPEVEVLGTYDTGVGTSDSASEGKITERRIETRPALRPGEILEYIPGVIITQHSGDGKANQYFLRGFNLDHGTDFAIDVAGMPVNMPTHAHGQGYADLNFLIPELVSGVDYRKGPYYAEVGDFSAAGAASIHYAHSLPQSIGSVTIGENQYVRGLLAGSPQFAGGTLLYGIELVGQNGPWENPEHFKKFNTAVRYSRGDKVDGFSVTGMAYVAEWNSTDQIPQRAVDSGYIGRFGAIDPTDGGETSRYSLSYEQHHDFGGGRFKVDAFAIHSKLNLWSNFTFFLDDQINGDQFEQAEERTVLGLRPQVDFYNKLAGMDSIFKVGLQLRRDDIDPVGLYHTDARTRIGTTREDHVIESSAGIYVEEMLQVTEKFRTILGLRDDFYNFDVDSSIPQNSGKVNDSIVSPKINLIFGPWAKTEYFVNYGYGFHSNDARGTTITVDPSSGDPAVKVDPLVRSKGGEAGRAHRDHSQAGIVPVAMDAETGFRAVVRRRCGHDGAEPPKQTHRHRVDQPLQTVFLAAGGPGPCCFAHAIYRLRSGWRLCSGFPRESAIVRRDGGFIRSLVRHGAISLLRAASADRGQFRALGLDTSHQPARRLQDRSEVACSHGCVQPVRSRRQ